MRILLLTQHYWPEPLPKAHEIAEGLVELGHEVTVVTGFPNYPSGRLYPGYTIKPWTVEERGGVRIIRVALYPDHSRSALLRLLNYASFALSAAVLGPVLARRPEVILAIHPPLTIGLPAWVIGACRRAPFVLAVADLWPEAIQASGLVPSPAAIRAIESLGRFVYRRAAMIAVVTPPMLDHLAGKGTPRERLDVLSDWADERVNQPAARDEGLAVSLGMAGRFNVVFAGQIGIFQRLDTVLDVADLLRSHPQIRFTIAGDGVERERLAHEAERRGLANVRFLGLVPPERMPRIYALADALLVHLSGHPVFRLSIPGKVYTYMAAARPILAAVDGIAVDVIREAGAGLACPPEDPQAMAAAVLTLASLEPAARQEMGRRGRELFLNRYSRAIGVRRCEALLVRVGQRRRSRDPQEALQ